jgi:GMP synthase-like glutamine amidotransferase
MLLFIDLEHERLRQDDPVRADITLANRLRVKYRLEDISGEPCLLLRYFHVNPELLAELRIRAVVVSGNATEFAQYRAEDLAGLRALMAAAPVPLLAFCGGCQLLAQSYGAAIGPIGPLPAGADDPHANHPLAPGMIQERGFLPVRVVRPHPLFAGLGEAPVFLSSHYWEVKTMPPGFDLYASSEKCRVQMLAHSEKPIVGVQLHPEYYSDEHPAGRQLIANFFRYAGILY